MKRVLRFLICLYPARWRSRYGKELEALLEDAGSGQRDAWDLFRRAMEMQMKTWSFGRIVMVCGIAGVLLAGTVAFSMPYRYRSTTILRVPDALQRTELSQAAMTALSKPSLVGIINDQRLYVPEREVMPIEDVIDRMRRAIEVRAINANAVAVRFAYQDPPTAQQVAQTLAGRFTGFEVLDPPSPPERMIERKRYGLAGLGFPAGLLFGVVLALILRRRSVATS
jgi:LPS O-antigen subunit length determinant protein (WzzB/FepE family)